jgi:hypothetical protein
MSKASYPPAFCSVHGLFPAVGSIGLGAGSSIKILNSVTNCRTPGCNQTSCEILPGEYRASDKGHLDLLLDPSISPEALAAIRELATKLHDGQITPEEAKTEISRIAPQAAGIFKGWTRAEMIAGAGLIVAILALAKPSSAPSVTVQPIIERTIERPSLDLLSSSALTKVPLPRPRPKNR